jgi:uncharacterized membrane protein YkvA (DUF1232 family)
MLGMLRGWFSGAYRQVKVLVLAALDSRVPWKARALALAVGAYLLSPFDLVPDWVPFAGWLDDAVVVPLGLWAVFRMIPRPVLEELRAREPDVVPT